MAPGKQRLKLSHHEQRVWRSAQTCERVVVVGPSLRVGHPHYACHTSFDPECIFRSTLGEHTLSLGGSPVLSSMSGWDAQGRPIMAIDLSFRRDSTTTRGLRDERKPHSAPGSWQSYLQPRFQPTGSNLGRRVSLLAYPSWGNGDQMEQLSIGLITGNTLGENAGLCRVIGVQEGAAFHSTNFRNYSSARTIC